MNETTSLLGFRKWITNALAPLIAFFTFQRQLVIIIKRPSICWQPRLRKHFGISEPVPFVVTYVFQIFLFTSVFQWWYENTNSLPIYTGPEIDFLGIHFSPPDILLFYRQLFNKFGMIVAVLLNAVIFAKQASDNERSFSKCFQLPLYSILAAEFWPNVIVSPVYFLIALSQTYRIDFPDYYLYILIGYEVVVFIIGIVTIYRVALELGLGFWGISVPMTIASMVVLGLTFGIAYSVDIALASLGISSNSISTNLAPPPDYIAGLANFPPPYHGLIREKVDIGPIEDATVVKSFTPESLFVIRTAAETFRRRADFSAMIVEVDVNNSEPDPSGPDYSAWLKANVDGGQFSDFVYGYFDDNYFDTSRISILKCPVNTDDIDTRYLGITAIWVDEASNLPKCSAAMQFINSTLVAGH